MGSAKGNRLGEGSLLVRGKLLARLAGIFVDVHRCELEEPRIRGDDGPGSGRAR
jgi:hypothetical protein